MHERFLTSTCISPVFEDTFKQSVIILSIKIYILFAQLSSSYCEEVCLWKLHNYSKILPFFKNCLDKINFKSHTKRKSTHFVNVLFELKQF